MAKKWRRSRVDLSIERRSARSTWPPPCFAQVFFIDFEADEVLHSTTFRSHRRIPNAEKGIEHCFDAIESVQPNAPLRQLHRKGGGMRAFLAAALDRLVRDEPRVPAAAPVLSAGVSPSSDVAFVCIRNTKSQSIDRRPTFWRKMEDVF